MIYQRAHTFLRDEPADGGFVQEELDRLGLSVNNIINAQIKSNAAIAISKTTLGTYTTLTSYNPTWTADSGTNPAIGNGTIVGHYMQIGKIIFFRVHMTAGSTTTFGTAANWRIGLPAAASSSFLSQLVNAYYLDSGTAERLGAGAKIISGQSYCQAGGEGTGFWDSTTPITWAANDQFIIEGFYIID